MKALLLAGGLGTRLRPLTQTTPKPLVPVVNRPWLEHLLLHLKSQGIQHFVLAVKHEAQQIRAYFQDGRALGVSIQYSEEPDLLGTAGAIRHAAEHTDLGERFVVLNADIVHLVPLLPLLEAHRNAGALVTIGLTEVDDPSAYGVVEQTVTGRIVRFVEKPPRHAAPSKRINAGIYVMEQAVLRSIPVGREVSVERETFPELIRRGGLVQGCLLPGYWMDMGTPERYLQVHADALSGRLPLQIPGFQHSPGIWTGKDVYISKSVTLVPPVVIGNGVQIGPGSTIGPCAVLGDGVVVASGCSIVESVVLPGVQLQGNRAIVRTLVCRNGTVALQPPVDTAQQGVLQR